MWIKRLAGRPGNLAATRHWCRAEADQGSMTRDALPSVKPSFAGAVGLKTGVANVCLVIPGGPHVPG
jgi:hypothetical protein